MRHEPHPKRNHASCRRSSTVQQGWFQVAQQIIKCCAKRSTSCDAGRTGSRRHGSNRGSDFADHGARAVAAHSTPCGGCSALHALKDTPARRKPDAISPNVPLRELVLAWYEARGYRGSPASPAVWPIELVLRHREDAARAYAFVVQNDHVSVDRITALIEQAREIGMMRVAVIAEAGYESGAKEVAKRRHVRLIDRSAMEAELSELQLPTAAKIIALARKRSAPEPSPA